MLQIINRRRLHAPVAKLLIIIIIVSNINRHLTFKSIVADCQHGFRSQRSCEIQLVQFYHDLVSKLVLSVDREDSLTS